MIEGLQLSIPKRMAYIKNILTIGLLVSVLSGLHLWCGEREFPYAPAIQGYYLDGIWEIVLLAMYCVLLLASMFLRKQRLLLFFSMLLAVVLVLADVNRLQPWFYFYNAMLLVFVFYNGRVDDSNKFTAYFITLQLVFASVYFFAGLNRLGTGFIEEEFSHTIAPLQQVLSERHYLFFLRVGVTLPFALLFMGLGLIITPIRYLAIALVIIFHAVLFFIMLPAFGTYNYALWISQLVFIFLAMFLFSGKTKQRYFSPSFLFNLPLFYVLVILFLILPFFNQSGRWPQYLTLDFKNKKPGLHTVGLEQAAYNQLPNYERSFCKVKQGNYEIDYESWCLHELNATCTDHKGIEEKLAGGSKKTDVNPPKNAELAIN